MLNLLLEKNAKNKLLYKHSCGVDSQHDYNLGLTNLLLDQDNVHLHSNQPTYLTEFNVCIGYWQNVSQLHSVNFILFYLF